MVAVSQNRTLLPVLDISLEDIRVIEDAIENAPDMTSEAGTPTELRAALDAVVRALRKQMDYNAQLRIALDDALRTLQQSLDQRPAVGLITNRPASPADGTLFFSTDETPEKFYVRAGGAWHAISTD